MRTDEPDVEVRVSQTRTGWRAWEVDRSPSEVIEALSEAVSLWPFLNKYTARA